MRAASSSRVSAGKSEKKVADKKAKPKEEEPAPHVERFPYSYFFNLAPILFNELEVTIPILKTWAPVFSLFLGQTSTTWRRDPNAIFVPFISSPPGLSAFTVSACVNAPLFTSAILEFDLYENLYSHVACSFFLSHWIPLRVNVDLVEPLPCNSDLCSKQPRFDPV